MYSSVMQNFMSIYNCYTEYNNKLHRVLEFTSPALASLTSDKDRVGASRPIAPPYPIAFRKTRNDEWKTIGVQSCLKMFCFTCIFIVVSLALGSRPLSVGLVSRIHRRRNSRCPISAASPSGRLRRRATLRDRCADGFTRCLINKLNRHILCNQ